MIWVFDLDNTLYQTDKIKNKDYSTIHKDHYLKCLLHGLEGDKYIFTNATLEHAEMVLHKMDIMECITDIIDRRQMKTFKPYEKAFDYFIKKTGIFQNEQVLFFEDTIENLFVAKQKYGWKTVFILPISMPKPKNYERYVDFLYHDIHSAVESFTFHPGRCYSSR